MIVAILLAAYVVWNFFFLLRGEIPPSIFKQLTGLPCPTTGGVRSLKSLFAGRWQESFLYNPFTLFFITLAVISIWQIIRARIRGEKIALSPGIFYSWLTVIILAWITKFILPVQYW